MQGLDTNVLIRYLTQDDAKQATLATHFIERACTQELPGFINRIVLCELVWVFETAYRYNRDNIIFVLEKLLRTSQFYIEDLAHAWQALAAYKKGQDFADYLIGAINKTFGCEKTISFDRKTGKLENFELLTHHH